MIQFFLQAPVMVRLMSRICWLRAYASLTPDDSTNLEQTCRQGLVAHGTTSFRFPAAEAPSDCFIAGTSDNSLQANWDNFPHQCYDIDPDPPELDELQPRPRM